LMDDMDILRALVQNEALVPVNNHNGSNTVKLQESGDERQKGYAIEIKNVPDEIIAINLDSNFPAPRKIFNNDKGVCKRADFVLFANEGAKNWIVYIEMKGGSPNGKEIREQLQGAQCFVRYCKAIGEIFWKQQSFLQNWEERLVSIKNISISKRDVRRSRPKRNDNMLTISAPGKRGLEFNDLVEP